MNNKQQFSFILLFIIIYSKNASYLDSLNDKYVYQNEITIL